DENDQEDDDASDDDKKAEDDDDEELTESDNDGDDFVHPKLTTHDDDIIHEEETDEDDKDSDNEVEGTNVEGAKSDEDATYEEDQGNEVQATQEIEDTHVTLTPVNPDAILLCTNQSPSNTESSRHSNTTTTNSDTGYYYKLLTELEYFCEEVYKATTEKLDWINPEGRQYPHDLRQPLPLVPNSQGRHSWITVRRDDDVLYKFKEGDFHRPRIQDIEDMLLLLVQGKVTNLNVEEHLQLGVESYQKKLNLTKPNTYRSNLRRQDAYTPYSDPRGFIYENKDKKN
ncbi:hypothetical protein Tco_1277208, partial [Tanacetum coccineum]